MYGGRNMAVDKMKKRAKRKPGGGRKPSEPDYNPSAILQNQMDAAVALYSTADHPSLQTIADELDINPIKVRKPLITADVYKSEVADQVNRVFNQHRASGLSHTEAIAATMRELHLSKASVTSYLPYEKGVYFPAETDSSNISVGAERIRRMRKREKILEELRAEGHFSWSTLPFRRILNCAFPQKGYRFPEQIGCIHRRRGSVFGRSQRNIPRLRYA